MQRTHRRLSLVPRAIGRVTSFRHPPGQARCALQLHIRERAGHAGTFIDLGPVAVGHAQVPPGLGKATTRGLWNPRDNGAESNRDGVEHGRLARRIVPAEHRHPRIERQLKVTDAPKALDPDGVQRRNGQRRSWVCHGVAHPQSGNCLRPGAKLGWGDEGTPTQWRGHRRVGVRSSPQPTPPCGWDQWRKLLILASSWCGWSVPPVAGSVGASPPASPCSDRRGRRSTEARP